MDKDIDIKEVLRKKGDLTEAEYAALDEYYTVNTIFPRGGKAGYFARKYGMPVYLDTETLEHLDKLATAARKPPQDVLAALVRKEFAVAG